MYNFPFPHTHFLHFQTPKEIPPPPLSLSNPLLSGTFILRMCIFCCCSNMSVSPFLKGHIVSPLIIHLFRVTILLGAGGNGWWRPFGDPLLLSLLTNHLRFPVLPLNLFVLGIFTPSPSPQTFVEISHLPPIFSPPSPRLNAVKIR